MWHKPLGYVIKGGENKVYRLKKALYGLKQVPRAWYHRIETYFLKEGFEMHPLSTYSIFQKVITVGNKLKLKKCI